ncbi:alpha-1,2-mannosyltransferase ALG9-like [Xenia sp. Carnegie-2017]|uniref:alpha-1,2-mannosyltransferase ALG9-like n=1 Tax=Xenia sp. Carnegie-2017 TaxID=2897299 RepID=UPI001F04E5C7|nr:alpha-1,2-mannosyltransferase ALG9-like [Xenia sp. Carnegie-2017]XP_046854481.1 alpha-1,2-mannosyltransferase ALG9-like [Xenia sp. Carnegie-2017]
MGPKLYRRKRGKSLISYMQRQENNEEDVRRPFDGFNMNCWAPKTSTAFLTLLSARYCSALWSNISDCDETYNYWEPTHYLIYGSGFQTWEYSPKYAIRSYTYLLLHTLPGLWQKRFYGVGDKVIAFYLTRIFLALMCTTAEVCFYRGVMHQFGNHVARILLFCLVFASGMYISAAAFLPSSFSMVTMMIAYGGWYIGDYSIAIFFTAVASLIGWPFSALLGFPIAFDLVFVRKRLVYFIWWSLTSFVALLMPLVYFDSYYYGKTVFTAFNIIYYNVFGEGGPDLYGTEPWIYYFLNAFLNFNIVFVLALISLPLYMLLELYLSNCKGKKVYMPPRVILSLVAIYLWILVFFTRPHKEERFLFPIYPLICLAGAVALSSLQAAFDSLPKLIKLNLAGTDFSVIGTLMVFALVSLSRSTALFINYHAPLDVYHQLDRLNENMRNEGLDRKFKVNLCVGKEWYRFPSSFFLPKGWELKFIRSEFRGQLPKPYSLHANATKIIPTDMNNMNKEEESRYIDVKYCHFLMDLSTSRITLLEPSYSLDRKNWDVVISKPFLDSYRTPHLYRPFYIPFLSQQFNVYTGYSLLKSKLWKEKSTRRKHILGQTDLGNDDSDEFDEIDT